MSPRIKNSIQPLTFALSMMLLGLAANAQTISLDTVLNRIEKRNPMLREYGSRAKALSEYSAGAKSWMAPMIGVGTFMTPYPKQMLMDERDRGSVMFSIEQAVPNPAKQNANRNYLRSRADIELQNRAIKFNELRTEAKRLYYETVVLEKKVALLKENDRVLELMLKVARIRYPYNQASLGSIYKAEGRLTENQNMRLMAIAQAENNLTLLKTMMTSPLSDSIRVDTTISFAFAPERIAKDTLSIGERRSDLKQIDATIASMRLNQRLQSIQSKPDFKLRFDHMQPIGNMPTQFSAMAMVSIPIAPWSSKMYKSEVKGMSYDIEAMQEGRRAIVIEARGMVAAMGQQIIRMQQQLENYRTKITPALKKNYNATLLAYEENREQLPLLIDGWEALNMAQMEYLDKMEEYFNMIVRYEKEIEE